MKYIDPKWLENNITRHYNIYPEYPLCDCEACLEIIENIWKEHDDLYPERYEDL